MSLVSRIQRLMLSDDTDDSERIVGAYRRANPDQRAIVDDIFISLCGYSLATLIDQPASIDFEFDRENK